MHSLSGAGVVVPEADVDEIQARIAALTAEMNPRTAAGAILIGKMATLSVRMERAAEHESAHIAMKVRHAGNDFDDERTDAANALFATLADDPRVVLKKLMRTSEGVEKLVEAWEDLRVDLTLGAWTDERLEQAANLAGWKARHALGTRLGALTRAIQGDFAGLAADDATGLNVDARKAWAKAALFEAIDGEIGALEAHHETLDFETLALDRAEAGSRALFDASEPAALARRYESEARRGFFKALKEFRQVEAEFAASEASADAPLRTGATMASSRQMPPPTPRGPAYPYPNTPSTEDLPMIDDDGRPLAYEPPANRRV